MFKFDAIFKKYSFIIGIVGEIIELNINKLLLVKKLVEAFYYRDNGIEMPSCSPAGKDYPHFIRSSPAITQGLLREVLLLIMKYIA